MDVRCKSRLVPARGTLVTTLRTLVLLFLVLSVLPQPALAQDSATPPAPESAAVSEAGAQAESPAVAPAQESAASTQAPQEDCPYEGKTNPPPGQTARLIGEDEILLSYRNQSTTYLRNKVIDLDASGNLVVSLSKDYSDTAGFPRLAKSWWLAAGASDLNGDHKAELVTAFKDPNESIAAIANPFSTATTDDWSNTGGRVDGGAVRDVDMAAGNLDGRLGGDQSDEIAVAFRDDEEDVHVLVLDGDADGTIKNADNTQTADRFVDHHQRGECGDIWHVAVETGDVNGDAYDDEIVMAFKDSGSDLQILVFKQKSDGTLDYIYAYDSYNASPRYDNVATPNDIFANKRPIDVTTGDLDGDLEDEIVVAFRNGDAYWSNIQLIVFDNTSTSEDASPQTMDYQVGLKLNLDFGKSSGTYTYTANDLSLAAGDLDGDGLDEIALGYNWMWFHRTQTGVDGQEQHLRTFNYIPKGTPEWLNSSCATTGKSCLVQLYRWWTSSHAISKPQDGPEAAVSVATGDMNADGQDEIAFARTNPDSGDIEVRTFTATSLLKSLTIDTGTDRVDNFWLAMGDYNGDSYWGTYTGHCYVKDDLLVQSVIHAPPFWPEARGQNGCDNDYRTGAGFGWQLGAGEGNGRSAESSFGGSATVEKEVQGISGSFTRDWERTSAQSTTVMTDTVMGSGVDTTPLEGVEAGEEPTYGAVQTITVPHWCYDYSQAVLGTVPVCILKTPYGITGKELDYWYGSGPTEFPDSWVPLGMNLAEHRDANQPNSWAGTPGDQDAQLAVDGNTDGTFSHGSVAATLDMQYPWWEVDLGGLQWIDAVLIWNRTDCCPNQLADFYVFVTEKDSFPSGTPEQLASNPEVWFDHFVPGQAKRLTSIPVNGYGRMVRVQMATRTSPYHSFMNIAEVQVYGMPGTPDQWPKAAPGGTVGSGDSFTVTWRDGIRIPGKETQTVSGRLYFKWPGTYVLEVERGSADATFNLGLHREGEDVTESGQSRKHTIGLGIRSRGWELSTGASQRQSNITTWESDVDFNGKAQKIPLDDPNKIVFDALNYEFAPYVWLQQATSTGGLKQEFLVLDYWVPLATPVTNRVDTPDYCSEEKPPTASNPLLAPQAPRIRSSTHPDPNSWYKGNTATCTWRQPSGDPATVESYDWILDRRPDTVPGGSRLGLVTTQTYDELDDGIWYLHVRAMSDTQDWSEASHRMIRVDAKPPQVSLALDPPYPTGNLDWYLTPVNVTVSADDGLGSGVTGVEVSTDGLAWQPYTAPLALSADTPGTTVYARAMDAVGNVSEPVSTTVKIDRTAPDSHVAGGVGPGTLVAEVKANSAGNQELVLAGAIADTLSGRAGMVLGYGGMYWDASATVGSWHPLPDPSIEVNWVYTTTNDLGAGYHIFTGRATDEAGNLEEAYEIGRVKWFPQAAPDLGGSSLAASQTAARPGDEILFTVVARNGGFQEAHVAVSDTLPEGLEPVLDTLPAEVVYDPATRTLTWPSPLLWPGWWVRYSFLARVDEDLGATSLENRATFHAFWPNTDLLPDDERQQFEDREQTVVATATVAVDPDLPADADVTPPLAILLPPARQIADGSEVALTIVAPPDASRMYLREWTPDPISGDWTVAQNSGWIDYSQNLTWTLSDGQGVKYIGVWVADGAGNVSTLDQYGLIFVNRIDASQVLTEGQRIQYRGLLEGGERIEGLLTTQSGDPDLFVWKPRNAFWPDRYFDATLPEGGVEYFANLFPPEAGRYLLEVQAVGDSEYELSLSGEVGAMAAASGAALQKARPEHPLTVSDPLTAGQLGPEVTLRVSSYLPVVLRNYP